MVGIGSSFPNANRYAIAGQSVNATPSEPATEQRDAAGNILLKAGNGADNINVSALGNGFYGVKINNQDFRYTRDQMSKLTIDAGNGDNSVNIDPSVDVNLRVRSGAGRDAIVNGANRAMIDSGGGNDFILNTGSGAQITGGDGDDALISRGQQNLLAGGEGNDSLESLGYMNTLRGEGGNDIFRNAGYRNTVHGGPGDDRVFSQGRENYLRGGWGNDAINSRGMLNTIDGGPDNDRIRSFGNYNTVLGGMNGGWDQLGVMGYGNIQDAFHGLEDLQKLGISGERPGLDPNGPPSFDSAGLFQQIYQRLQGLQTQQLGGQSWAFNLLNQLAGGIIR